MDGFGRRIETSHGVVLCEGKAFSRRFRDDLWQKTVPQNILCVDDGIRPSLIVFDLDLLLEPRLDDLEAPPQAWNADENCIVAGNQQIRWIFNLSGPNIAEEKRHRALSFLVCNVPSE